MQSILPSGSRYLSCTESMATLSLLQTVSTPHYMICILFQRAGEEVESECDEASADD
eukprot:COSAG02_NODE_1333_length_13206_cov_221.257801_2_plen_57_part_00